MKQTQFTFGLRLAGDETSLTSTITEKMRAIKGVERIDVTSTSPPLVTLTIQVTFADAKGVQKLHRNLMTMLMALEGVTINLVGSTPSDIF